MLKLEEISKDL